MKKTIIEKGKETVTRAESSARQGSLGGFVKRGLPMTLAALTLTSMLASCDELSLSMPFGGEEVTTEAETLPYYNPAFTPSGFGLGPVFDKIRYKDFILSGLGSSFFDEKAEFYKDVDTASLRGTEQTRYIRYCTYASYAGLNGEKSNIMLYINSSPEYQGTSGWTHTIVSAGDDFALVSKDAEGNVKITGMYNGEIRSDAGFLAETVYTEMNMLVNQMGYENAVDYSRKEFFGFLYSIITTDTFVDEYFNLKGGVDGDRFKDENGNVVNIYNMAPLLFANKEGDYLSQFYPQYNIPDNYIDQVLSGEIEASSEEVSE